MFIPPDDFDQTAIKHLEEEIMVICNTCKDLDQLLSSSKPLWDWACTVLNKPLDEVRHEVEIHELDEHFPNPFLEEKDHLLKLPIVLLEHIHSDF